MPGDTEVANVVLYLEARFPSMEMWFRLLIGQVLLRSCGYAFLYHCGKQKYIAVLEITYDEIFVDNFETTSLANS